MPSEAENAVAAWFHAERTAAKAKPRSEPPAWMTERAEAEYLAWRDAAMVNRLADRDDWERADS